MFQNLTYLLCSCSKNLCNVPGKQDENGNEGRRVEGGVAIFIQIHLLLFQH